MAAGAAVAVVGGTILSIEAQRKEAEAQARAARQNAKAKREQALELLDRLELNNEALIVEGELLKGKQKIDFAGRGIETTSGSALSVIEETNSMVARQLMLDKKEADFKVKQLRAGAEADITLAGDIKAASRLRQMSTFLSGAGAVAGAGK